MAFKKHVLKIAARMQMLSSSLNLIPLCYFPAAVLKLLEIVSLIFFQSFFREKSFRTAHKKQLCLHIRTTESPSLRRPFLRDTGHIDIHGWVDGWTDGRMLLTS